MSMMSRKLIKDLLDAFKASEKNKTTGYDTSATVKRIENGTAWVHIPGGVDETPAKLTINANVGDIVQVRVSGGKAFLIGNGSAPPTDDTTAIKATRVANKAHRTALQASEEATEAWNYAGTAAEAAISAQTSADSASEAADRAWDHADEANQAATEAKESARSANNSANNALVQLSVVEDVAGTLRWISEHGDYVLTDDDHVVSGTVYFIYQNGDYVPIASPDPTANPSEEGWYVLDVSDSQAQYIMAHLAVTSAGLWVLPVNQLAEHPLVDSDGDQIIDSDNNPIVDFSEDPQHASGYKVLLSGTGMSIYNDEGAVVADYGTTTTIGEATGNNVHIDSESVNIREGSTVLAKFDGDGLTLKDANGDILAEFSRMSAGGDARIDLKSTRYNPQTYLSAERLSVDLFGDNAEGQQWAADMGMNGVYKAAYTHYGIMYNGSGYPVGTLRESSDSSATAASSTWELGTSVTVEDGLWLVIFGGAFGANENGMRQIAVRTSPSTSITTTRKDIKVAAVPSNTQTCVHSARLIRTTTTTTLYEFFYQNSGSALTIYPDLVAVKIL